MQKYLIKRNGKYLQTVKPNPKRYAKTSNAPTMSTPYIHSDYISVWGSEQTTFEFRTATDYLKVVLEEYRWKEKKPAEIRIIPIEEE